MVTLFLTAVKVHFLAVFSTCLFSPALHRGVIRDLADTLLASDPRQNTSPAFDAAADFTDETLLWSASPLSALF